MDYKGIWSRLITAEQAHRFLAARREYETLLNDDPGKAIKNYERAVSTLAGEILCNLALMRLDK